jgi:type III pantothenate kinase
MVHSRKELRKGKFIPAWLVFYSDFWHFLLHLLFIAPFMNLIVDIGNSAKKLALYENSVKKALIRAEKLSHEELEKRLSAYKIENAIVSSAKTTSDETIDLLTAHIPYVHYLSYRSRLPFSIEYDTPETLGPDRIAAAAGAFLLFPGAEILIIDAGTAITYEFLIGKTYKGGNISPGLSIRFKALNKFTGRLPLVTPSDIFTFPGRNTADAIIAGVVTGVIYEINEYIRTFEKKYSQIKVILTGGDGESLKGKINHQVSLLPDLVIDGLNYILECNAK